MELSFEQIKSATFGAVKIFESNGCISFRRFTDKQTLFNKSNPDEVLKNYSKSLATASICIDFYSISEEFSVKLKTFVATTQKECYVDLLIDGKLVSHQGYSNLSDGVICFNVKLPKGNKRFSFYLCNLFACEIESIELSDGADFLPVVQDKKFLFIGDSITQGYTAKYPSMSYANAVARMLGGRAMNHSIGGAFFNANMIDSDIGFIPDKIFIAYGTNDWSKKKDIDRADAFVEKIIRLFPKSQIIAITPIWRGDIKIKEKETLMTFSYMQKRLKEIYAKYSNIHVIDGLELVPHEEKYFIDDILHPNDIGFTEYAQNLVAKMKALKII